MQIHICRESYSVKKKNKQPSKWETTFHESIGLAIVGVNFTKPTEYTNKGCISQDKPEKNLLDIIPKGMLNEEGIDEVDSKLNYSHTRHSF